MEAGNSEPTSDRRAHWWHSCELWVCKQSPYCFNRHEGNCHNNRWKKVLLHLGCLVSKAKLRLAVLTKTAFYSDFMVGAFILFVFIHMPLFSPPCCPVNSPPLSTQSVHTLWSHSTETSPCSHGDQGTPNLNKHNANCTWVSTFFVQTCIPSCANIKIKSLRFILAKTHTKINFSVLQVCSRNR